MTNCYIQCFDFGVSEETTAKMSEFEALGKNFPKDLTDEEFISLADEIFSDEELIANLNSETAPTGSGGYYRAIETIEDKIIHIRKSKQIMRDTEVFDLEYFDNCFSVIEEVVEIYQEQI